LAGVTLRSSLQTFDLWAGVQSEFGKREVAKQLADFDFGGLGEKFNESLAGVTLRSSLQTFDLWAGVQSEFGRPGIAK
jgi:hypothetical protein